MAQETHRPATEEEKKIILPSQFEEQVRATGSNLARESELKLLHQGMLGNALELGLDDNQIKGYLQKLTDHGLSEQQKQESLKKLSEDYLAQLQLKNMDKIITPERRKELEQKMDELQKQYGEGPIPENILEEATKALEQEIAKSEITKANETKQKELLARMNQIAQDNTFVKKPLPALPDYGAVQVMVPMGFSLKDYKPQDPLCLDQPAQNQNTNLEQYMKGINQQLEGAQKPLFHQIYFAWGYNRGYHSKSDAKFTTADGTFIIHDAHGDDRPSPFDPKIYFNPTKMSIPQYNIDIGVMFNPKWGMEASMNHMKWVFDRHRPYEMSGEYNRIVLLDNPTPQYGWDIANPFTFEEAKARKDASFLNFEHTDGYNYASLGMVYKQNLLETKNKKFSIDARFGAGAGLMIPKTKVIFHQDERYNFHGLDNRFKIAGGGVHGDVGIKFTLFNSIFFQAITRGTYIKVKDALVDGPEARLEHVQPIASVQFMGQIGYQYTLGQKKKSTKKLPLDP
jgi:hypothetical protein